MGQRSAYSAVHVRLIGVNFPGVCDLRRENEEPVSNLVPIPVHLLLSKASSFGHSSRLSRLLIGLMPSEHVSFDELASKGSRCG